MQAQLNSHEALERARIFKQSLRQHGLDAQRPIRIQVNPGSPSNHGHFLRNVLLGIVIGAGSATAYLSLGSTNNEPGLDESVLIASGHLAKGKVISYEEHAKAQQEALSRSDGPGANTDLTRVTMKNIKDHLNYVKVKFQGKEQITLDAPSRILLVKVVARETKLSETGLSWKDLYGVIHAETHWISRSGMGANGVESHGLSQFEPATAKGYNVKDANDPAQALLGTALLMRDAAIWTQDRIKDKNLDSSEHKRALLDGVSVFYNTSWKIRKKWQPENGANLPAATKTHIENVEAGRVIASQLSQQIRDGEQAKVPGLKMMERASKAAKHVTQHLHEKKETKVRPT